MEGGEGHDTYVIGAGDTVLDRDGVGEVRWDGQQLTGGARSESDPANTYRSADSRFTYALEGTNLTVTDTLATDQTLREPAVIENFQSGQMGITLTSQSRGGQVRQDSQQPDQEQRQLTRDSDRTPSNTINFSVPPTTLLNRNEEESPVDRRAHHGPVNEPYLDRAYAALMAGDSNQLDQVAIEFSQSAEGQRMAQMGDQLLTQQQLLEQQQLQEQQQAQVRQGPVMRL